MEHIPALKEWAVICHALLAGEQVLDLRKGGLREDGRHFGVQTRRAWLYPTSEHQRSELLRPAYRHWLDLAPGSPVGSPITVHGWVDITDALTITEPEQLDALSSKVIWSADYAASRMHWKHRDPLWVLVCRAFRLHEPITIDWADGYGGCTSWVDLEGLATDPMSVGHEPALSDEAFTARRKGVLDALGVVPDVSA